jgi:purine-binding chemotaxis protein CheW
MTDKPEQSNAPCENEIASSPLAQDREQSGDDDRLQLVTFDIADEEFAIDILPVQEIVRMMTITRMPKSPPSVEGVVNLRGQITPVVDLRKRFGLEANDHGSDSRIVVVEVRGRVIGFIVDRVNEVLELSWDVVDPTPSIAGSVEREYLRGVAKLEGRLLILLDLERLFEPEETDRIASAAAEAGGERRAA